MKRLLPTLIMLVVVAAMQAQRVTCRFTDVSLSDALRQLNEQSADFTINFLYNELEDFRITTTVVDQPLPAAIRQMIGFYPVSMTVVTDDSPAAQGKQRRQIVVECIHKASRHLTGTVVDAQGQAIAYASIAVLHPADSTLLSGGVSNESGYFAVPYEPPATAGGAVLVRFSYVGYTTVFRLCPKPQAGTVVMQAVTQQLSGVTVKGHFIHPTADGLVVNIENSLLASLGYASDVLRHLPFVTARHDHYEVMGKGTPLIYINNRLVRDNAELKQLHASDIRQVRVILNPGAEYDATASAVIRITTLKPTGEGFSGLADGHIGAERTVKHGASGTLNYRTGGLDVFGTLGYTRGRTRANQTDGHRFGRWSIGDDIRLRGRNLTLRTTLGTNYQWDSRSSAGIRYQYTATPSAHFDCFSHLETLYEGVRDHLVSTDDYRQQTSGRHYVNAYCDYAIGDESSLKLDADYLNGTSTDRQEYHAGRGVLDSRNRAHNLLYAGRLLYASPLWGGTVKTGAEASYTNNVNHYHVGGSPLIDHSIRSTDNEATQRLFAGFVELACGRGGKWSANVGARYEYTDFDYYVGGVRSAESSKAYAGFFPSASVACSMGGAQLSLAYRYTTSRPSYFALRNAIAINSPHSYEGGNPELQPSRTNMLTLTCACSDLQFMATYANVDNGTAYVYDIYDHSDSIIFFQSRNIDSRRLTVAVSYSPTFFKIWKPEVKAVLTKPFISYAGKRYDRPTCYMEMSHYVALTPTLKAGFEMSCTTAGNAGSEPAYHYADFYAGAEIIKTFLNDQLRLGLAVTNLFNTSRERWRLDTNGIVYEKWNDDGRRTLTLTLTYRFNQSKSKYRGTASTTELNRL